MKGLHPKRKKRIGRGPGSGHGKTACKGHKGQNSRSGGKVPLGFEGGQMPYQRRVPKRGFKNIFKTHYIVVDVGDLNTFEDDTIVDKSMLLHSGKVKRKQLPLKILGEGVLEKRLVVKADKFSKTATSKIESAGGRVEVSSC